MSKNRDYAWEFIKKRIDEVLDRKGIISLRGNYELFAHNLYTKQKKYRQEVPHEEVNDLMKSWISQGLTKRFLRT